ncbi:type IV secretion system protein [Trueperella pyogenes]|uniref:type IV secretion system protein n=1 Tax=Trueperella pyogenes TaxID=1661 RepID=UPI00345E049F
MKDIIISMLTAILGSSFATGSEALKTSVSSYNATAFEFAQTVNSVAVKPVAASIVAIVLVIELARITTRYEGDQKTGTQVVAAAVLKAVLLIVAIQNVDLILGAMNEVGEKIIGATSALTPDAKAGELSEAVSSAVEDMDTIDKAGLMLVLFVPWLLATLGSIAVKVIVFIRFAELYILSAAATLPLAFLGNQDTKGISIGYLKRYGGAVLHGVMIIIIVAIYSMFQLDAIDLSAVTGDTLLSTVTGNIGALIAGPVFFLFLIFGSGKLARSMLGDG